ncbi:Glycosyltransferase involved in cell wall bisynthesis [Pseudobutyrivibrio ruminis]|uniref:Glycosyltransferase involved in cell wall bisynthesis n=1 Tax=Pseudobutyrivibrio ruminis TaxID=46206 RepID=A0A1H7H5C7_9FIRM|nr:glycosyltransferase [Pseudobutyrivibrio ruminis]SEK45596.1 Glycosyltransferase involved in cell wall bisynthesis [Pseudobutyrivibrio ruminis]
MGKEIINESQQLLVSIIVPVYNVEQYLEQCVESLINQSYKKIEIILVDDGSTDMSSKICDSYAENNNNIIVIHKINGGLSDARNVGLEKANGDYISFVDSDDYVERTFIEDLLTACINFNVSVSCTRWRPTIGTNRFKKKTTGRTILIDSEKVLFEMLNPKQYMITTSVWDRLYKKEILKDVIFPKGKCYEDTVFSPTIINRARRIAYIDKELYNYRIRQGSITNPEGKEFDRKIVTDKLFLAMQQLDYFRDNSLMAVYNTYRSIYYQEILSIIAQNPYEEYEGILYTYLQRTKLKTSEIMDLKESLIYKAILFIKTLASGLIIKIYKCIFK